MDDWKPPRMPPKVYQILIKTHKLTVLTTVAPTITVAALKADVLSALSSDVNQVEHVPPVSAVADFELCKAVKERGKLTGEFQPLDNLKLSLKDAGVINWEPLFVQFRDPDSGKCLPPSTSDFLMFCSVLSSSSSNKSFACFSSPGELLPVVFVPFEDDEDEVSPQFGMPAAPVESSTSRGKRKARPD